MEPYQYWTIAGFIFILLELITLRTFPLVLAGSMFFAGVIAFKFPDFYIGQVLTCVIFIPIFLKAINPYIKKKFRRGKKDVKHK